MFWFLSDELLYTALIRIRAVLDIRTNSYRTYFSSDIESLNGDLDSQTITNIETQVYSNI